MSAILRKHIEKTVALTDDEFNYIRSHFTVKKLRRHSFLVQEGDLVKNEYFIIQGCLKAYLYDDISDKEHIFQFAVEENWITDSEALYRKTASSVNIDCLEDTEVLCLTMENREKLCMEMHKMEYYFSQKTYSGYISLQNRIISLLKSGAKERYETFVKQYPQLLQRIPKTIIASYLGVSRETLSRIYC